MSDRALWTLFGILVAASVAAVAVLSNAECEYPGAERTWTDEARWDR